MRETKVEMKPPDIHLALASEDRRRRPVRRRRLLAMVVAGFFFLPLCLLLVDFRHLDGLERHPVQHRHSLREVRAVKY